MTDESEPPAGRSRSGWMSRAMAGSALTVVLIWAVWSVSLLVYQEVVQQRYVIERPDRVLVWTPDETRSRRDPQRPYLNEDVLNSHVSFDSEYYLSIAVGGYDDPDVTQMSPEDGSGELALNYAFMPAYPIAMRLIAGPLQALGLAPMAAASVAGVTLSLLAALIASLALFSIARRHLGDGAGVRAAFYLLVFPTGFFLAQVYTEAFFLALSLGSLALLDQRRPLLAGIAAVLATLTRPVGVLLAIPIAMTLVAGLLRRGDDQEPEARGLRDLAIWTAAALLPVAAYLVWSASPLGQAFTTVQSQYFGQQPLAFEQAWNNWRDALAGWDELLPETRLYYVLELAAVGLAVVASLWALRRWPAIAVFSLAVVLIPLTTGAPQSMARYVLAAPSIFLLLAALGERVAFDRTWTLVSVLLLAMLTALFSFDFWVA
ncbi:MAG TPA: mannosyltransferase family protein [Candidatus Limnocylindria bacterium]